MGNEFVGMLCLEPVRGKILVGKIREVERDDHRRPRSNGCGQDVTIIGIRLLQTVDRVFISNNQRIANVRVHQLPCPLQLLTFQVRAILQYTPHPLFVNLIRPASAKQVGYGQPHQETATRSRIQDASVI